MSLKLWILNFENVFLDGQEQRDWQARPLRNKNKYICREKACLVHLMFIKTKMFSEHSQMSLKFWILNFENIFLDGQEQRDGQARPLHQKLINWPQIYTDWKGYTFVFFHYFCFVKYFWKNKIVFYIYEIILETDKWIILK